VTADEMMQILAKSPAKQLQHELEPAPTWLVKHAADVLALVIAAICNQLFKQVTLPHSCKKAVVHPLLKKCSADPDVPASYRLISNLSFLSKVV